jgi:transcriptional regulator with XRE-family HTH domain
MPVMTLLEDGLDNTPSAVAGAGALVRTWRERRRFSQQELSNRSGVSTRHLSRVETGRAHPSPDMLLHLAEHLEIPRRERNRLLLAGGYAPRYPDTSLEGKELAMVMAGLRDLLDAHLPYPALLMDTYWDIVDANTAVDRLLAGCDPTLLAPPVNVVQICLHPAGFGSRIRNRDQWAAHLYQHVAHRAEHTHDPRHLELVDEVKSYLGEVPRMPVATGPVLELELQTDDGQLRFFSTSARLDTANDATLEGLHLEMLLPADVATRRKWAAHPPHDHQVPSVLSRRR